MSGVLRLHPLSAQWNTCGRVCVGVCTRAFCCLVGCLVGWVLQPPMLAFWPSLTPTCAAPPAGDIGPETDVRTWWGSQLRILRKHLLSNGTKTQGKKHGHPGRFNWEMRSKSEKNTMKLMGLFYVWGCKSPRPWGLGLLFIVPALLFIKDHKK